MSVIPTSLITGSQQLSNGYQKYIVDATGGNVTLTLPAGSNGVPLSIIRSDAKSANTVTVTGTSDGKDIKLQPKTSADIISYRGGWYYSNNGAATATPQMIYVVSSADAKIADGSQKAPFSTLTAAMASINDASPSKRYQILIGADELTEVGPLALKANVFIIGKSRYATRLNIPFTINSATWNDSSGIAANWSGFENCTLIGASSNFDFSLGVAVSTLSQLYFIGVSFNNSITLSAYGNSNKFTVNNCEFNSGFTVNGGTFDAQYIRNTGGTITLSSTPGVYNGLKATLSGSTNANLLMTGSGGDISLLSFNINGTLTIPAGNTIRATADSIPITNTILGTLTYINAAQPTAASNVTYTAGNSGNWSPVPLVLNTAVDQLAASVKSLSSSANISYDGKSGGYPPTITTVKGALDQIPITIAATNAVVSLNYSWAGHSTNDPTQWVNPPPNDIWDAINRLAVAVNTIAVTTMTIPLP